MPPKPGPHLVLAVICEKVLQEQDGVLTLVRIIDRITIGASGQDAPKQLPPSLVNFMLVLGMKSGDAHGRYTLRVVPVKPSGETMPPALMPVLFEGDDRGVNAVVQLGLPVDQEGVYWLDVFLDDEKDGPCVTRVPLRVFYQPMQTSALR